jgi:ribonuclease J
MHLAAHAELARSLGVPHVVTTGDGKVLRLAPGEPDIIDTVEIERHYRDGTVIGTAEDVGVAERRKLSFAGHVAVSLVLDKKGAQIADPDIELTGIPIRSSDGKSMDDLVLDAIESALQSMPRPQRRDPDVVGEAVRRAVRGTVNSAWGKKPICTVFVAVV